MTEKLREALEVLEGAVYGDAISREYIDPVVEAARRVLNADLEYVLAEAVNTDGVHHKQWWLEHIAGVFGIDLPDHEPGIAP